MSEWVMRISCCLLLALAGCNQGAQVWSSQGLWSQQNAPQVAQIDELTRRANELDLNNRELQTQNGLATQQVQILRDEVVALRKQIKDTADVASAKGLEAAEMGRKVETMEASLRQRGSAMITANNSLRQSVSAVDIPGLDARQDGELVRIAIPSDQLFAPGTANLVPTSTAMLDRVAEVLLRQFGKHKVGIEGYTDNSRVAGMFASQHQLASAQASAVLEQLMRRNRLSPAQLLSVSHGSNHPLASNASQAGQAKNRRIEIVIYPDTVEN